MCVFGGFLCWPPWNPTTVWLELVVNVWPGGFCREPWACARGRAVGPPTPTGRGGPHHERPGISTKECKTDRKILCKLLVKQLLSNPRVIRASCLTAERVPRGSASRQPDGLVGLVVLSVSLFETRGDLDRLCRPPSFLWFESRLVEVFARCALQAFAAPVASDCFHDCPYRNKKRRVGGEPHGPGADRTG